MEQEKTPHKAAWVYRDKKLAGEYDRIRYQETKKKRQRDLSTQRAITEALGRLDDCRELLDMPCGTGRLSGLLMENGFSYIGSDISFEMIEVARGKLEKTTKARFLQANGEHFPFKDNSIDCVVCVRFLGLISPEPRFRIFKELRRVSRRYLLVAAGYFRPSRPFVDPLFSSLPWLFPKGAKRVRRHAELRQELQKAGWSEHFWLSYKSRGFFSTTKMIAVYRKENE